MAESISEGTLSSFTKQVGDHVEQDEEIASIETDKIDVSVNAPAAGVITELLVSEGDTVTVGQDLAKIDAGASGGGEAKAKQEPKSPASDSQETSSQPEGQVEKPKEEKPKEQPKEEKKEEKKDAPPPAPKEKPKTQEAETQTKQDSKPKSEPKQEKKDPKESAGGPVSQSPFGKGSRGEHRVRIFRKKGILLTYQR